LYWHCELDGNQFQISAKVAPSELNKGKGKILFSLDSDEEIPIEYQNFEIENLGSKIKQFIHG
jgi:hypothetical protein